MKRTLAIFGSVIALAAGGTTAGLLLTQIGSSTFYISPTGTDSSPCSQTAPCSSLARGYAVAQPGDSVLLMWNGLRSLNAKIGPVGSKTSGSCAAPGASGCVRFAAAPGYSPTITGAVQVCANYVELDSLIVNATLVSDGFGNQITTGGISVGSGDNSCQPNGAPPHDFLIANPTTTWLTIVGSAHDGYVQGGSVGGSLNVSNQLGGVGNNGLNTSPVNHVTYDGTVFSNMTWTDPSHHHPECLHMDYADDSVSLVNVQMHGCRVFALRVEAEGDPAKHVDSQTNNLFDGLVTDTVPVSFDCHDAGCVLTGNIVKNSTLGGGLSITNDCALVSGRTCTMSGNSIGGTAIPGGCPSVAGWTCGGVVPPPPPITSTAPITSTTPTSSTAPATTTPAPTAAQLIDQAVAELKLTTVSYSVWVANVAAGKYPNPAATHWGQALALLSQAKAVAP